MKAFPNMTGEKGMDLRDYFAAKAVQSLWANGPAGFETRAKKEKKPAEQLVAELAYSLADHMMAAREKNSGG
jgi:hypothetical protein